MWGWYGRFSSAVTRVFQQEKHPDYKNIKILCVKSASITKLQNIHLAVTPPYDTVITHCCSAHDILHWVRRSKRRDAHSTHVVKNIKHRSIYIFSLHRLREGLPVRRQSYSHLCRGNASMIKQYINGSSDQLFPIVPRAARSHSVPEPAGRGALALTVNSKGAAVNCGETLPRCV